MRKPKRTLIAYILWFVLGAVGGHRFYIRKFKSAFAIIAYQCVSMGIEEIWWRYGDHDWLSPDTLFWITMLPLFSILIHDAFRIPGWIDDWNHPFPESPVEFLK